jgi:rare lipoprotein A
MFRSPWPKAVIATVLILLGCYAALVLTVPARGAECQTVVASWYGRESCANPRDCRTANGQKFNEWGMTAAHMTAPFGTRFRVTARNGRSVVVTITDRGDFAKYGRAIDLSRGAAKQLGMIRAGTARVCLTRL